MELEKREMLERHAQQRKKQTDRQGECLKKSDVCVLVKWVLITMAVFLMKLAVNNLAVFLIKWQ